MSQVLLGKTGDDPAELNPLVHVRAGTTPESTVRSSRRLDATCGASCTEPSFTRFKQRRSFWERSHHWVLKPTTPERTAPSARLPFALSPREPRPGRLAQVTQRLMRTCLAMESLSHGECLQVTLGTDDADPTRWVGRPSSVSFDGVALAALH